MTIRQNIVFRLVGLFIFFAPKTGANFLADVTIRVNERVADERSRSLAA